MKLVRTDSPVEKPAFKPIVINFQLTLESQNELDQLFGDLQEDDVLEDGAFKPTRTLFQSIGNIISEVYESKI